MSWALLAAVALHQNRGLAHRPCTLPSCAQDGGYGRIRMWASIGWGCVSASQAPGQGASLWACLPLGTVVRPHPTLVP